MTPLRAAFVVCVALLVVLGAGCGADKPKRPEKQAPGASPSPKDRYVARANAICVRLADDGKRLAEAAFRDPAQPPSATQARAYKGHEIALQRRALRDLRALPAPAGDEPRTKAVYDALEQTIGELAAVPADRPPKTSQVPSLRTFQRLASAYGLSECAKGGQ